MTPTQQIRRDLKKCRPKERLYTAASEWDFTWYPAEVQTAIDLYSRNNPPVEAVRAIADRLKRPDEEVAVLIMDLALQGRL